MDGDPRNPKVSLLRKFDIPIEHLTYEYVEKCADKKELERIIRILRSGEEGSYPDLLRVTEERLRLFAPESRVLRVETPILTKDSLTNEEWSAVEKELLSWEEEMKVMDKSLDFEKSRIDIIGNKNLPEVRKINEEPKTKGSSKTKVEINTKNERIKSSDYASWDKFDVDKELLKIDIEEERKQEKNEKKKRILSKQTKEKNIDIKDIDKESYSTMEQLVLANQAKDRGNECYKSGDWENALKYYDVSIRLYPTANAFNNRAMTYLKLKKYEKTVEDCNKVLDLEKNNIKALHRRATAYQYMSENNKDNTFEELAWNDLNTVVQLEPNNKVAQADLQKLKKKLNIADVGKKFRMPILESEKDADKNSKQYKPEGNSTWNFRDEPISIEKLPLTYYGPSTSTFQCEPYSMVHRALSGSVIPGQIMCKCNSNRQRQNPLCQKCGEAMSKPKPSNKPKINYKKDLEAKNQSLKSETNVVEKAETINNKLLENAPKIPSPEKDNGGEVESKDFINLKLKGEGDKKEDIKNEDSQENLENVLVLQPDNSKKIVVKESNIETKSESNTRLKADTDTNKLYSNDSLPNHINKIDSVDQENLKTSRESNLQHLSENSSENNKSTGKQSTINDENTKSHSNNKNEEAKKVNETSSNRSDPNLTSKKSKNKKKKSKEHKEVKFSKQMEPVKIVHAAKYLHPTSVEPKVVNERRKEPQPNIDFSSECHFKAFVPKKQCLSKESGRLNIPKKASEYFDNEKIKSDSSLEGNKENIGLEEVDKEVNACIDAKKESVESAYEFMKTWEELKKVDESYAKRAEIIRMIRPTDLGKVIGIKLDSDMLSCLLECLQRHFVESDPKVVVEFLKQLPKVPRFGLVSMFLADNDKKKLKKLIETAENKGFKLDDDVKRGLTVIS